MKTLVNKKLSEKLNHNRTTSLKLFTVEFE
jgi:hypothetical protein